MKSLSPEEAIAILSDMKIDIPIPKAAVTQIKRNIALDMAISALSCSEIPNSSDTISRQAAIDAIDEYNVCGYVEEPFEKLEKALLKLPPAQRWIPCNEKMPEKSGYYLVTCGDDDRSQEVDCYDKGNNRFVFYNVIAWMTLPEPYGEEGEK